MGWQLPLSILINQNDVTTMPTLPTWLIYVLVAVGVFLVIEVVLVLAGKKDLAKKLVGPFILVGGALAVFLKLRGGASAIKKENERIKDANKQIKIEHGDLQDQVAARTEEHEQKVDALQQKIDANDEEAQSLKDNIAKMEEEGAQEGFKSLSAEKQKEILDDAKLPSRKNF